MQAKVTLYINHDVPPEGKPTGFQLAVKQHKSDRPRVVWENQISGAKKWEIRRAIVGWLRQHLPEVQEEKDIDWQDVNSKENVEV